MEEDSYDEDCASEEEWEDGIEEIDSSDENLASLVDHTKKNADPSGLIPFSTDSSATDGFKYECLPTNQVLELMTKTINEVNDILNVSRLI